MPHLRRFFPLLFGLILAAAAQAQVGPAITVIHVGKDSGGFDDFQYYGQFGGIAAYSMATTSCNPGTIPANWDDDDHPVIAQNMFRLADGRFEQLGQSWLKHGFCAVNQNGCGTCQNTDCDSLGLGCADTYSSSLNDGFDGGPKYLVNATTGTHIDPHPDPTGPSTIRGRLQVAVADIDPAQNPGARYFVESQYVSEHTASFGNGEIANSWRPLQVNSVAGIQGGGATVVGECAPYAWQAEAPQVVVTEIVNTHEGGGGLHGHYTLGHRVTDLGGGTFRYDYVLYNRTSERSAGSFAVPLGASVNVTNLFFNDVDYHSGEIFDGTDWEAVVEPGSITWSTTPYDQNVNANALRWATMYNFRFDANVAPEESSVTIGTFKPGGAASASTTTLAPPAAPINPCDLPLGPCPEDVNNDYIVGVDDMLEALGVYGQCGDGSFRPVGDVNDDCCVDVDDLLLLIAAWNQDCTPEGACCLAEGGCQDASEAECDAIGGAWGGEFSSCEATNCPAPGACCFTDGSCQYLMADDCSEESGTFQGDGVNCSDVDCPVAGAGDECDVAMIANLGANAFETDTATPSSPEPDDAQCAGTYLDWNGSQDIWFRFDPESSGLLTFHTCDPSSYDTSMAIYQDSCDNQVACNGDADGGSGCQSYYSAIDLDVSAGSTYYIRIGGWQAETGSGTLTIE